MWIIMEQALDFDDGVFGNIHEYNQLITGLFETLKSVTAETFWNMHVDGKKGLSTIIAMEIIDLILDSYSEIAECFYANENIAQEYPYFVEIREMIECLLSDHFYDNERYLNLAVNLSSDFFTLLEVKVLLFEGKGVLSVADDVMDEYINEFTKFIEKFNNYRDEFIELYDEFDKFDELE